MIVSRCRVLQTTLSYAGGKYLSFELSLKRWEGLDVRKLPPDLFDYGKCLKKTGTRAVVTHCGQRFNTLVVVWSESLSWLSFLFSLSY